MSDIIKTVKTKYDFETKDANKNISFLIDKLKALESTLYKKTHKGEYLSSELQKAQMAATHARAAVQGMTEKMKEQESVIKNQTTHIAQMKEALEKSVGGLQNTLDKWKETGATIGSVRREQQETATQITTQEDKIRRMSESIIQVKDYWSEIKERTKEVTQQELEYNAAVDAVRGQALDSLLTSLREIESQEEANTQAREKFNQSLKNDLRLSDRRVLRNPSTREFEKREGENPYYKKNLGIATALDAEAKQIAQTKADIIEAIETIKNATNFTDLYADDDPIKQRFLDTRAAIDETKANIEADKNTILGIIRELVGGTALLNDANVETWASKASSKVKVEEKALRELEKQAKSQATQQEQLIAKAKQESAAFREVAGASAAMKQSSIASYIAQEEAIIAKETDTLEKEKTALNANRVARVALEATLRAAVQQEGAAAAALDDYTEKQNKSAAATKRNGDAAPSATSKHLTFGKALAKVSKTLHSIKSRLLSTVKGFKDLASHIRGAIPGAKNFGGALGKLASTFKRLFVMRVLRNLIGTMLKGFKEGIDTIVQYSAALNGLDANNANQTMSELASTTAYLKNVLGSAAIPILNAVIPLIRQLSTAFATAVNYLNQFFSALGGKSSWSKATSVTVDYASTLSDVGSAAGGASDAVEDLQKTILGFDEINKLNDASASSGSGGSGSGGGGSDTVNYADAYEEVPIDNSILQFLATLQPYIDNVKQAFADVKQAASELFKSEGFQYLVSEVLKGVLTGVAGVLSTIASVINTVKDILNTSEIKDAIDEISEAWSDVWESVQNLVESDGFKKLLEIGTYAVLTIVGGILKFISGIIDGIRLALDNMDENGSLDEFKEAWQRASDAISDLFDSEGFQYLISTAFQSILYIITAALTVIGGVVTAVKDALNELKQNGTLDDIEGAFSRIKDAIKKIADSAVFQTLINSVTKQSIEAISDVLVVVADALEFIADIIAMDIPGAIEHLVLFFMDLANVIAKSVLAPLETMINTFASWIGNIPGVDGEKLKVNFVEPFNEATSEAREVVEDFFDKLGKTSEEAGEETGKNYYEGFSEELGDPVPMTTELTNTPEVKKQFAANMSGVSFTSGNLLGVSSVKKQFATNMNGVSFTSGNLTGLSSVKKNFAANMNGVSFTSGNLTGLSSVKKNFATNMSGVSFNGGIDNMYEIWKGFKNYMNGVEFSATARVTTLVGGSGGHYTMSTGGIIGAASGRFVDSAQIFTARENGIPEYVGKFGSHSAVANNYQIVSGIAEGVSHAMMKQHSLMQEQNQLLAQIAAKNTDVTTSSITSGLSRQNRRAGMAIVPTYS